jgi:hypothetical protein
VLERTREVAYRQHCREPVILARMPDRSGGGGVMVAASASS